MLIAIRVYDGLTALDAVGPYDVLTGSPAPRSSSGADGQLERLGAVAVADPDG